MSTRVGFIGRTKELEEIHSAIRMHRETSQIFCLYGDGGVGKTRLLNKIHDNYSDSKNQPILKNFFKDDAIYLIQQSDSTEWAKEFLKGASDMAIKFGISLKTTNASDDLQSIKKAIEDAISQKKQRKAIILQGIINPKKEENNEWIHNIMEHIRSLMNRAINDNIHIITVDYEHPSLDKNIIRITHDEPKGIQDSITKLIQDIGYNGEVSILFGQDDLGSGRKDLFGHLIKVYPKISASYQSAIDNNMITSLTFDRVQEIFLRNQNVKAIWTTWNGLAREVVKSLRKLEKTGTAVYSFDFNEDKDIEFMGKDSPWKASVVTEPWKTGRLAVRLAIKKILGESVNEHYPQMPHLITQQDVQQYRDSLLKQNDDQEWSEQLHKICSEELQIYCVRVLDLDDYSLHNSEKLLIEIADALVKIAADASDEKKKKGFDRFYEEERKLSIQRRFSDNISILSQQSLNKQFIEDFNDFSNGNRILLFFDTFDQKNIKSFQKEKEKEEELGECEFFGGVLPLLKNTVTLVVGRDANKLEDEWLKTDDQAIIHTHKLEPLSKEDCENYWKKKYEFMPLITIEEKFIKNLIHLSARNLILLDLAAEWSMRGISLEWVIKDSIEALKSLDRNEMDKRQQEFEKALVNHLKKQDNLFDRAIVLMAHVFPLNEEMLAQFLYIDLSTAKKLYAELNDCAFIKELPFNKLNYLQLHDKMQDIVESYVLLEADKDKNRRRLYSKLAFDYFKREAEKIMFALEMLRKEDGQQKHDQAKQDQDKKDVRINVEMRRHEDFLFNIYRQLWKHADNSQKLETYKLAFKELRKQGRQDTNEFASEIFRSLFKDIIASYSDSNEIGTIIEYVKITLLEGNYPKSKELCNSLLDKKDILRIEQIIEAHILRGNAFIRLGNVRIGLDDFAAAVRDSREKYEKKEISVIWLVRSLKELGWAYRLVGYLKEAQIRYEEASILCYNDDGLIIEELQEDYGKILNNLAFVYSNEDATRDLAMNCAKDAILHWKSIGDKLGLGAAYHVAGVAYYRKNFLGDAEKSLKDAYEIFKEMENNEWLAQVYVWQGAILRINGNYEVAQEKINKAIEIGTDQIKPMAYNRLGRVYMSMGEREFTNAKKNLEESIRIAINMPDYLYWFSSLARLIMIAADSEKKEKRKESLKEFRERVLQAENEIECPDKNSQGIAYLGLARLALGLNDKDLINQIVEDLKKGIGFVTGFGSYADRSDISRIEIVEKEFPSIRLDIIREIGKKLLVFARGEIKTNKDYIPITNLMMKWATWEEKEGNKGEATNEK